MTKVVFLVHRKPGLTEEEFSTYWRETHSQVCRLLPGLKKYVQNHGQAVIDDVPNFANIDAQCVMFVEEVEVI